MKVSKIFSALTIVCALAACGGGGGSSPITLPSGNPNPSPSGHPTSSPSSSPTSSPTTVPTMQPTTSPTGAPTSEPTMTPTAGSIRAGSAVVSAEINFVNGNQDWYTAGTASWTNHAGDTSSGGAGQTIDSVPCLTGNMGTGYHVHAYVGFYVNGTWEAIPQGIGMENPVEPTQTGQPSDNDEVLTAQCFYKLHTHDYSGIIHVEDPTQPQAPNYGVNYTYATLQSLFDEWGEPISIGQAASFTGPVTIYMGFATQKDSHGNDLVTSYSQTTAAPNAIVLQHHVAYWIVVGALPAGGLPQVSFFTEN